MKHRLFNALTALSLVAFMAIAVLWFVGSWFDGYVGIYREQPLGGDWELTFNEIRCFHGLIGIGLRRDQIHDAQAVYEHRERFAKDHPGSTRETRVYWSLAHPYSGSVSWDWLEANRSGVSTFLWRHAYEEWRFPVKRGGRSGDMQVFAIPVWWLLVPFSVVPLRWLFLRERRWHRVRGGLCKSCGYDLRASPERCPECGTVVPPKDLA